MLNPKQIANTKTIEMIKYDFLLNLINLKNIKKNYFSIDRPITFMKNKIEKKLIAALKNVYPGKK